MMINKSGMALQPMNRSARIARVRHQMGAANCDALIVTKAVNIRWLCGFTGSNGTLILRQDGLTMITDGRYEAQLAQQLAAAEVDAEVVITREPEAPTLVALSGAGAVGLESEDVTWSEQRRYATWLEGKTLIPTEGLIEKQRRIKDDGELQRLRWAAAIADAALSTVSPELEGSTEAEVARRLDRAMLDNGADGLSFATIVASGLNSAKPHATPSDRVIQPGDMVVIDFGASVDGYGSDMTRSFLIGSPADRHQELFDAVLEAQRAGVAAVADGVEEREIDRVCRESLAERGLGDAFIHGTGHGIGLEIHEQPILSSRATGILRSGYVVTVEPGVYLRDVGGIRIEDSVVVTDSGCEPITLSPKDPSPNMANNVR